MEEKQSVWSVRNPGREIIPRFVAFVDVCGVNIPITVDFKVLTWSWNFNTLATRGEELTHWKRPWYWERLKAGEGDDRGWNGWMASAIQWTWVWARSRSWWWTGRPGVLQSMGLQRVGHDWATELNWTWCHIKVNWKEMQSSGSPKHTNGLGASSDLLSP